MLHTDARISGMIATVGGRLIEGVAKKTVAQFATNLAAIVVSGGTACAVLAAGRSSRMGAQKALLEVGGVRLVDRALGAAAASSPTVLVASPEVAGAVAPRSNLRIVVNDDPGAGMRHSLALAHDAVGELAAALAVLLVDTPLVDAALVARMVAARGEADVAHPARDGRAGHPVVFGPRARALLAALPAGDTLRLLRDDPRLSRALVPVDDDAPFVDVDTPGALAALARALRARG